MAKIWIAIFFQLINLNDNVGIFIQVTLRFLDMSPTYTLIQWGRTTYICISKLTIIGSDNGLSPGRHQAIIWTIARILLMNASSAKWRPSCLGLIELSEHYSLDNGWLQDSQWAMIRINNDLNSTVSYCVTRTQWVNNCKTIRFQQKHFCDKSIPTVLKLLQAICSADAKGFVTNILTHLPLVPHICVGELG